jgi:hypothetical protein
MRHVELLTGTGHEDPFCGFEACVVRFRRFGVSMVW